MFLKLKLKIQRALLHCGYSVRPVDGDETMGYDPYEDMHRFTSSARPVIFDVGANVGQSVQRFRTYFKTPEIHSFEPGEEAFKELAKNTKGLEGVHIFNSGMGARRETKTFVENQRSDMSSFLEPGEEAWARQVTRRRSLQLDTIDDYCSGAGIGHIDILKSDTQGYDLEVLRGSVKMLGDKRIDLILLEVTFSEFYEGSPRFDELYAFLADHGMTLIAFYDLHYQRSRLSWTDALFKLSR